MINIQLKDNEPEWFDEIFVHKLICCHKNSIVNILHSLSLSHAPFTHLAPFALLESCLGTRLRCKLVILSSDTIWFAGSEFGVSTQLTCVHFRDIVLADFCTWEMNPGFALRTLNHRSSRIWLHTETSDQLGLLLCKIITPNVICQEISVRFFINIFSNLEIINCFIMTLTCWLDMMCFYHVHVNFINTY